MYRDRIAEIVPRHDPRVIECWMRLEYGTLDHLSPSKFKSEVLFAARCADEAGAKGNADLLASYGFAGDNR